MGDKPSRWVTYPKTSAGTETDGQREDQAEIFHALIVSVLTPLFTSVLSSQLECPTSKISKRVTRGLGFGNLHCEVWRERCTSVSRMRKKVGELLEDAAEARQRTIGRTVCSEHDEPSYVERSGAGMPWLRLVSHRDASCVRRRPAHRARHVCRRTTRRSGRSSRSAVRRPRRCATGQGTRRSRHSTRRRVCDERRQALQVGAARQAAHSQEAAHVGNQGVPTVARGRDPGHPTGGRGVSRRNSRAVGARRAIQVDAAPRPCAAEHARPSGSLRRFIPRPCCGHPIPKVVALRTTCSSRICASSHKPSPSRSDDGIRRDPATSRSGIPDPRSPISIPV